MELEDPVPSQFTYTVGNVVLSIGERPQFFSTQASPEGWFECPKGKCFNVFYDLVSEVTRFSYILYQLHTPVVERDYRELAYQESEVTGGHRGSWLQTLEKEDMIITTNNSVTHTMCQALFLSSQQTYELSTTISISQMKKLGHREMKCSSWSCTQKQHSWDSNSGSIVPKHTLKNYATQHRKYYLFQLSVAHLFSRMDEPVETPMSFHSP